MAKRFGRNQKRAMRQQIADLERQIAGGDEYRKAVSYCKEVLGRYTAALPPQTIEFPRDMGRYVEVPVYQRSSGLINEAAAVTRMLDRIQMGIYRTDVQFDGIRNEMHAVVKMPSGRAYAATAMLRLNVPPKFLARQFAELLEPGVSEELRGVRC